MGHALLWAGGAVPVFMLSLACLAMGASLFLGYVSAASVARHLGGVLGMALGVSVVLGAFSESAGGILGERIGGGLAELTTASVAALVGLGCICAAVWASWLTPSRAKVWARVQEIEKPVVPLQAKADGVTGEESAALAFEGDPGTIPAVTESPYLEDVRVRGQIPEGAAALGAEETTDHDGFEEQEATRPTGQDEGPSENEERSDDTTAGPEGAAGAESEVDALLLETVQGDEEPLGEDLADGEEPTDLDAATAAAPEDGLSAAELEEEEPLAGSEAEAGAGEFEEGDAAWETDEADFEEEAEEEEAHVAEGGEEELIEVVGESTELKEGDGELGAEEEPEVGVEYEDAAALEDDVEEEEREELEEREDDEAEELETSPEGPLEQGDLFESADGEEEPEVILEPQAIPTEERQEVLMKAAELFLERDRVAVSLLQRQFRLDFEESCAVLDELQEMGLIGPYLGGNRRDILLSRDEWLERVGGAT
jgi:hypothetical protein